LPRRALGAAHRRVWHHRDARRPGARRRRSGGQTHAVIDKIAGALQSLGGRLDDVVRTRIYVSNLAHWEAVARAHGERFGAIQPANTLVEARLVGSEYLVEIEAEADVPDARAE